jgi:hypothetical protein
MFSCGHPSAYAKISQVLSHFIGHRHVAQTDVTRENLGTKGLFFGSKKYSLAQNKAKICGKLWGYVYK